MAKSPMEALDDKLFIIKEEMRDNITRKEELNNELHELNLKNIELEHRRLQYEDAMTALKRNEVNK